MRLHIQEVKKSFGSKEVLRGANAVVEQGMVTALLGRNGAGKTTLFSLIAGEKQRDGGEILLEEEGILRPLALEDVFFMVAEPQLPNFLTGREMIEFFIGANREKIHDPQPADVYFDQIAFDEDDRDRLIQGYSTGMKNKLQMLMFMILRPKVILMDEPLTSLDVVVQHEMKVLIRSIHSEHIILFSTHILQLAKDLCDDVLLLREGIILPVNQDLQDPDAEEQIIRLLREEE